MNVPTKSGYYWVIYYWHDSSGKKFKFVEMIQVGIDEANPENSAVHTMGDDHGFDLNRFHLVYPDCELIGPIPEPGTLPDKPVDLDKYAKFNCSDVIGLVKKMADTWEDNALTFQKPHTAKEFRHDKQQLYRIIAYMEKGLYERALRRYELLDDLVKMYFPLDALYFLKYYANIHALSRLP